MNYKENLEDEIIEESKVANNIVLGAIIGILIPVITVILFNFSVNKNLTFTQFFVSMQEKGVMSGILSLTGIPNLIMFFIFLKTNKMKTVKGIMLATVLLAITVFIIKFSI